MLNVMCYMLHVVCYTLHVIRYILHVTFCMLHIICYTLSGYISLLCNLIIVKTNQEAIKAIINCSIVLSPHTLTSEWIVMTNARVFHNNEFSQ